MRDPKPDKFQFPPKDDRPATDTGPGAGEPYGLTPEFERIVAATACTTPSFWPRLLGAVSLDGFRVEAVRLLLQAVMAITQERGAGPSSVAVVLQRIRTWVDDGKTSKDELREARQAIVDAFEGDLPPADEVLGELVPILRRRLQQHALDTGYRGLVQRGDMAEVEELLGKARQLGRVNQTLGTAVDPGGFELIRRLGRLKRLPTSIAELDDELKGGLREGEYWLFAGGYGSGKSMALSQVFGSMLTERLNACLATLELSVDLQYARLVANLVGIPIDDLLDDMADEGERRLELLCEKGLIGYGKIKHFAPDATNVRDLKTWILAEEDAIGAPIEGLVVDYPDKMGAEGAQKKDEADKSIAEGLRNLMDREINPELHLRWVIGATQIKSSAHDRKRTKKVEGHHAADSIHKPRICDGMVTVNSRDDGDANLFHITKNRTGVAGGDVGPLPTEWPYGRITTVRRADWPF